jgi:hypothetical protein
MLLTMSTNRDEDRRRRERFLAYFNGPPMRGDRAKLMEKTGITKGRISQYFDVAQPFGERAAISLAVKLDLDDSAFLTGDPKAQTHVSSAPAQVAQQLSFRHPIFDAKSAANTVAWGAWMSEELKEVFALVIRDNSMAPYYSKGDWAAFRRVDSSYEPEPGGKPLLVIDGAGDGYLREFHRVDAKRWKAVALREGYDPMLSDTHGLRIYAVLIASESA